MNVLILSCEILQHQALLHVVLVSLAQYPGGIEQVLKTSDLPDFLYFLLFQKSSSLSVNLPEFRICE